MLVLSSLTRDLHGKQISCEAENGVGSTRITHTLDVECENRYRAFDLLFLFKKFIKAGNK